MRFVKIPQSSFEIGQAKQCLLEGPVRDYLHNYLVDQIESHEKALVNCALEDVMIRREARKASLCLLQFIHENDSEAVKKELGLL